MVPNGSLNGSPPAKGFPPGALWQAAQSAARARYSPRATNSGVGTMSAADTSGSRSIRCHKTTEPITRMTVNAATPMILNHLDPIIFIASPILEQSKTSIRARADRLARKVIIPNRLHFSVERRWVFPQTILHVPAPIVCQDFGLAAFER